MSGSGLNRTGRDTGAGAGASGADAVDGRRAARLEAALRTAFRPALLRVADDSAQHAGHAGSQPGGQTHYSVLLVSDAFHGLSRVARHRAVHAALAGEFAGGMHALALVLRTPEEQRAASG